MTQAEARLIEQASLGDRAAFARLVEGRWNALVGLARSVIGDVGAEDAVQDALIIAWDKLGSLRTKEAFSAWLTRIVLRRCMRQRRSWRDLLPIQDAAEPIFEPRPEAELDLQRCLRALAPRQRAVMYMTVVEGRSESEIAELMQITAASVRSHRRRARQRLRHLLESPSHVLHGASHGA